jgi:hypothetical protein
MMTMDMMRSNVQKSKLMTKMRAGSEMGTNILMRTKKRSNGVRAILT